MGGGRTRGQGPGPRASHTPKAGRGSNSWAAQWRLRPGGPPGCVTLQPAVGHSEPGSFTSSVSSVSPFLGRAVHRGPPSPSIHGREAVSREEGGWGQGRRHPGRPPGLTQENLRVGKVPASHPRPCRIPVPMETLRSPPCCPGPLRSSWTACDRCFLASVSFPESQEEEAARGQHWGWGGTSRTFEL